MCVCCNHYSLNCHAGAILVFHKLCKVAQFSAARPSCGNSKVHAVSIWTEQKAPA